MIRFTYEDEDGLELEVTLPSKREVCPTCDGTGTTVFGWGRDNPAVFTGEDFDQDPDLMEDLASGRLDRCCPECGGNNVVEVVDADLLKIRDPKVYKEWRADQRAEADYRAMVRSEQRFGC